MVMLTMGSPTNGSKTFDAFKALAVNGSSSTTSSTGSTGSSSASGTAASGSAAASTTAVPKAGEGAKPIVNMALLMLVGVFGLFFVGL
jgi:hypothetical protein